MSYEETVYYKIKNIKSITDTHFLLIYGLFRCTSCCNGVRCNLTIFEHRKNKHWPHVSEDGGKQWS